MGDQDSILVRQEKRVRKTVLIIDQNPLDVAGLEKIAASEGFVTATAVTGAQALQQIEENPPALILLSLKLPDSADSLALLSLIRQSRPEITLIMLSGQAEVRSAVDAMKAGASDCLERPVDPERFRAILQSCKEQGGKVGDPTELVYVSDQMKRVTEIMQRLSRKSDITVLVLGESGTGKNYLCRKMHELSARRDSPYVQIGCSNIPDHLIESELFGYEKGAFTDAKQAKKGLVEVAHGGTLLLDELGEMPYQFQAKVLTLLEEKRFRKVGALQDSFADVRILAATNRNLHHLVQEKKFRLDLFYRLNVATIELPSLRERPEDIKHLTEHFLASFARKYHSQPKTLEADGLRLLKSYSWPGNIRQLKNLLERLVVLSDEEIISTAEISASLMQPQLPAVEQADGEPLAPPGPPTGLSLGEMEERYIRTALKLTAGNQRRAADLLHISRDTLRYRLKKMGIDPK